MRLAVLICFMACSALTSGHEDDVVKKESTFTWREVNYVMPWLKGANMCAYYLLAGEKGIHGRYYMDCMLSKPRYIKGKQATIQYECCFGFSSTAADDGCLRVSPMENLVKTITNIGLTSFPIQPAGMTRTLSRDGAFTMFVPTNEALEEAYRADSTIRARLSDRSNPLIRYHMHKGRLYSSDFLQNKMIDTEYAIRGVKEKAILQKYCTGILTINCARIIMPNREATNGIVHVIDRVIEPIPEERSNVLLALQSDSKYSEFIKYVEQVPGLSADLSSKNQFTVFAPSNQALRTLDPDIRNRLRDKEVLGAFVKSHIVATVVCSAAILDELAVYDMNNNKMTLSMDNQGRLMINGQGSVTTADIVTRNGVIHIIGNALQPDFILGGMAMAYRLKLNTYMTYLRKAGLDVSVNGQERRTLFVPSDEAWANLTASVKRRIETDPEYLKLLLQYHMAKGEQRLSEMTSQSQFKSETSNGASLSLNRYRAFGSRSGFSIQGAEVTTADQKGFNIMIHIIDKVLLPPQAAFLDFIKSEKRFSAFYDMLVLAKVDGILRSLRGRMTFILPTNEAFENLDADFAIELKNSRHLAKVIRYHIWPMALYTSSFYQGWTYYVRTHLGEEVEIHREKDELLFNHRVHVEEHDISMTDGSVVHIVDEILRCRCPFRGSG